MTRDESSEARLPIRLLGRSGLRVSRLALGTMTFGQPGWGCDAAAADAIMDRFVAAGGNLIDTADYYSGGESERFVGRYLADRNLREQLVIASKFSFGSGGVGANATGNGRKSMMAALEGSLRRLGTDYIDLYILHLWDGVTPAEEVMRGLDDLVRSGEVRYVALSDVTGWYAARAQTLAEWRGYERLCAVQLEYSLVERGLELEFPTLCAELGMGILAWAPLCNGLLSGKHRSPGDGGLAAGRVETVDKAGRFDRLTARNWQIVAALEQVARATDRSMAQVAINWVANRPGVASVLLGATKVAQIEDTLRSLTFTISDEHRAALDSVSVNPRLFPYRFLADAQRRVTPHLS
ncbi:aldo/keto reductase [Sphingomonas sp. BAUL-RG-20F-R05-02]|uniref:aldo/keto reductase n=1 Tax=Sphingomonas sp. BAUL-RG-20F-R05-02 TaxID=2914830 RepID=UPI001F56077B|nr:aldo/keto reductase [Sphingomonas sp. BAUL-RG-20F-R05-02]